MPLGGRRFFSIRCRGHGRRRHFPFGSHTVLSASSRMMHVSSANIEPENEDSKEKMATERGEGQGEEIVSDYIIAGGGECRLCTGSSTHRSRRYGYTP